MPCNTKNPQDAIKKIHLRHFEQLEKRYIEVVGDNLSPTPQDLGKKTSIFMYNERGILDVIRWATTPVSNDYFDWVYEVIQEIKKNGYYIVSEKDHVWLGVRQETKEIRKAETDQIKQFVEYAKAQGSRNADRYYAAFTNLINKRLGIEGGGRDSLDQRELLRLKSLETVVELHVATLMKEKLLYKEIYQRVKSFMEAL